MTGKIIFSLVLSIVLPVTHRGINVGRQGFSSYGSMTRMEDEEMKMTHVAGKNKGHIILYALSTCVWCKKTKQLLDQLGVGYDFVEVDLLQGDEKTEATDAVKKLNPRCSFPTLSIKDQCVVGYDEQKLKEVLGS
jgi:glutaredoxin-like protein NrdH